MSEEPILLLGWREFNSTFNGNFTINDRSLLVSEKFNSGEGTGLIVWDGSVLLAKFLESSQVVQGKEVLELGCGTGVVGLSCGLLNAKKVLLTDLNYTLDNVRENVKLNHLEEIVDVFELDWMKETDSGRLKGVELVVAADVVWVEELVIPFVNTLKSIWELSRPEIFIAHQTRAIRTDALLFDRLQQAGFRWEKLDKSQMHPDFRTDRINIFQIVPASF